MVRHFPGSALVAQLFRQAVKPISKRIVNYAQIHPTFRRYGLLLPGRVYHRLETNVKIIKPEEWKKSGKISDEKAIEVGVNLMIEVVLFLLMMLYIIIDSNISQVKAAHKEEAVQKENQALIQQREEAHQRLEDLRREAEVVRGRIREELEHLERAS